MKSESFLRLKALLNDDSGEMSIDPIDNMAAIIKNEWYACLRRQVLAKKTVLDKVNFFNDNTLLKLMVSRLQ